MTAKIMILEDDLGINDLMTMQLRSEGYDVVQVFDGLQATTTFDDSFDLAILDIMVPKKDGFEVLEHIRQTSVIPIIFLTARSEDVDKMRALGLGADDFVTKPFSLVEVVYRCKAHLRRYQSYSTQASSSKETCSHGDIRMVKSTFEAFYKDEALVLSVKEFELLMYLIQHPGQVFTKQQLYEHVWGEDFYGDDNTVMVHISKLRDKLGDDKKNPKYIRTIKGLGYRMEKV